MKKIAGLLFLLAVFGGGFYFASAKTIYNSGKPNIVITSPKSVTSQRNTWLEWTWKTLKPTENVAIYLIYKNKLYPFTESYPNYGTFGWTTGAFTSDTEIDFKNGKSKIAVCPAGKAKIDKACGVFTVKVTGYVPVLKMMYPKAGDSISAGSYINVVFQGGVKGEKYKISLLYPAIVSPKETLLGNVTAYVDGTNSFPFIVPANITKGSYTVEVIQETNNGACVNVCAKVESGTITIK